MTPTTPATPAGAATPSRRASIDWGEVGIKSGCRCWPCWCAARRRRDFVVARSQPIYTRTPLCLRERSAAWRASRNRLAEGHAAAAGRAGHLYRVPGQCHQHRRRGADHPGRVVGHHVVAWPSRLPGWLLVPLMMVLGFSAAVLGFHPRHSQSPTEGQRDPQHGHVECHRPAVDEPSDPGPLMDPGVKPARIWRSPNACLRAGLAPASGAADALHAGAIVAVVLAVVVYIFLWRTTIGYRIRAVGLNPDASRYAGIIVPSTRRFRSHWQAGLPDWPAWSRSWACSIASWRASPAATASPASWRRCSAACIRWVDPGIRICSAACSWALTRCSGRRRCRRR